MTHLQLHRRKPPLLSWQGLMLMKRATDSRLLSHANDINDHRVYQRQADGQRHCRAVQATGACQAHASAEHLDHPRRFITPTCLHRLRLVGSSGTYGVPESETSVLKLAVTNGRTTGYS